MLERGESKEPVDVELTKLANNIITRMIMGRGDGYSKHALIGKFNLDDYFWFCKNLNLQGLKRRCKEIYDKFDAKVELNYKEA
ncbi:LOW QUALITY PROTEIN: hypothetical protein PanWU01x14_357440 [Parasponia andersonii]|uniref:Uncharacterized protein n=1 Tax=Parasponia andersonii TaxID=3476 RepID=A0A2P5A8J0_PARAD|nr:LOW QUALITY PROTEIN: hypothetical protein PanWU01x14_357440 [Parasponia andersonii]